jgi:hypothetical protein
MAVSMMKVRASCGRDTPHSLDLIVRVLSLIASLTPIIVFVQNRIKLHGHLTQTLKISIYATTFSKKVKWHLVLQRLNFQPRLPFRSTG